MTDAIRTNLLGLGPDELIQFITALGEPAFRARQLYKWIHQKGVADFEEMTDVSKSLRNKLVDIAEVRAPEVILEQPAKDGTRKWLLRLDDGQCIEAVFIPEKNRGTLCVSSQVGCALDCTFCATARQGFNRNLTAAEIIGQVWLARQRMGDHDAKHRVVSNVVMMGMGEPMLNFDNVLTSMQMMLDDNAYGMSKRRVTLSTSGVVPAIDRLSKLIDVSLAISLHAPNNPLRDKLVPINQKYPIEELIPACQRFLDTKGQRDKITIEYVMLDGVNDSPANARELLKVLKDLPCKVNLIPFNPFPDTRYARSSDAAIDRFSEILSAKGMNVITRRTRGDDIDAACGQLAGKIDDRSRRELRFQRIEGVVSR